MRVGFFGYDRNDFTTAVRSGLAAMEDVEVIQQIPSGWSKRQARMDFDSIVLIGTRGQCGEAGKFYAAAGFEVLLIDQPHLGRGAEQQYRISPVDHAWLPAHAPEDRLELLERSGVIELSEPVKRTKGQKILVCGQRDGDPTHGMSRSAFRQWAESAVAKCKSLDDSKVVWRPHPYDVYPIAGADGYSDPRKESLEVAMAGCWLVVVYTSNCGLKALLAGKPVLADGEAVYAGLGLTGTFSKWSKLRPPDAAKLRTLLARLAYTQWTAAEIATGDPFRPFLEPQPEPEVEPEPDDFTTIKGIGQASARAIVASGIMTFGKLCDLDQKDADTLGLSQPASTALRKYLGETSEAGG